MLIKPKDRWEIEILDPGLSGINDAGFYAQIVIDDFEDIHIAYAGWMADVIKYARNVTGTWEFYEVDGGNYLFMTKEHEGGLHIVCDAGSLIKQV